MATTRFDVIAERFSPCPALSRSLMAQAVTTAHDSAHDAVHLCRVWLLSERIAAVEGGDREILAAAALLHDCVAVDKDSPERGGASRLAGAKARGLLLGQAWEEDRVARVVHAIEAHSFSAGIRPTTIEAMILQDADRLDAIGAIGVARFFAVAGRLGRPLYDVVDPAATNRTLDDTGYRLDHFRTKLLKLHGSFNTKEGLRIGKIRHERVERFHAEFLDEIGAGGSAASPDET